jgi:hypothetical protein
LHILLIVNVFNKIISKKISFFLRTPRIIAD